MTASILAYTTWAPTVTNLGVIAILWRYTGGTPGRRSVTHLLHRALMGTLALFDVLTLAALAHVHGTGDVLTRLALAVLLFCPAVLLHLAVRLNGRRLSSLILYGPGLLLSALILRTDDVVRGCVRRGALFGALPGPGYAGLAWLGSVTLLAVMVLLAVAMRRAPSALARARLRWWLVAVVPYGAVLAVAINGAGPLSVPFAGALSLAATWLLVVSAYATYQYRLFDLAVACPWSAAHRERSAFYQRLKAVVAEMADLPSVGEALHEAASILGCSVALVTPAPMPVAQAGPGGRLAAIPREVLFGISKITVARELNCDQAALADVMRAHEIAAIVPFYPHSRQALAWLLLGARFEETVVSEADFRAMEGLFDRLADRFIDQQVALRADLARAEGEIQRLKRRARELERTVRVLTEDNDGSSVEAGEPEVVLVGSGALLRRLRATLPGLTPWRFGERGSALVIAPVLEERLLDTHEDLLLIGPAAQAGLDERAFNAGRLVDRLPSVAADSVMHRSRLMRRVREALIHVVEPKRPLLGRSAAFRRLLAETQSATDARAIVLEGDDRDLALAVAHFIAGTQPPETPEGATMGRPAGWVEDATSAIDAPQGRFFFGGQGGELAPDDAPHIRLPALAERGDDVTLLVHYFSMRFRARSGSVAALSEEECVSALERVPASTEALRIWVERTLADPGRAPLAAECGESTLKQRLELFEKERIAAALVECHGNRAQAARILGLKPNTLHYKLKRFGLG